MDKTIFIEKMKSNVSFTEEEQLEIRKISIERAGIDLSAVIAMEELAELQQEVSKQIRKKGDYYDLLQEIADAYVNIANLEYMFHITKADVEKAINVKIQQTKERYDEQTKIY